MYIDRPSLQRAKYLVFYTSTLSFCTVHRSMHSKLEKKYNVVRDLAKKVLKMNRFLVSAILTGIAKKTALPIFLECQYQENSTVILISHHETESHE